MKVTLHHLHAKHLTKKIDTDGFSFGALLFGVIWYWLHGMFGLKWVVLSIVLGWTIVAIPILWIAMAFKFHQEHYEHLLTKGYVHSDE